MWTVSISAAGRRRCASSSNRFFSRTSSMHCSTSPTKAGQLLTSNDRHKPVQVWLAQLRGTDRRQKVHEPTLAGIGGGDDGAQMDAAVTIFDEAKLPAVNGTRMNRRPTKSLQTARPMWVRGCSAGGFTWRDFGPWCRARSTVRIVRRLLADRVVARFAAC